MSVAIPSLVSVQQRRQTSLRSDFSWTLAGNAVYAAGHWLTLVLLAKLTQPELVGQYTLGMAIALPVFMLTSLQLRMVLVADIREEIHFGHYLILRLVTAVVGLAAVLAATEALRLEWPVRGVVLLVGAGQAIEMVSDIYYARLHVHNRMDRIARSLILKTALSVVGLALGVYLTGSLLVGVASVALARLLVFLSYDIAPGTHDLTGHSKDSSFAALLPRWDTRVQRELFRNSFPLGIVAALVALHSSIPRLFIEDFLGERELGIFAALAFLLGAGSMAVVSLGQSAFARLAKSHADGDFAGFRRLVGKLLGWGGALGLCGIALAILAGREILGILFRPEYAERAALLPWVMAAGTVGYLAQFLGYAMTAAGCNRAQVGLFVFTNLVLATACDALVARDGLRGAVVAMLIAAAVQFMGSLVILTVWMRRRTGENSRYSDAVPESQGASAP